MKKVLKSKATISQKPLYIITLKKWFMKKAQMSMFIILGVVLIIIIGVLLVLMPASERSEIKKGFDNVYVDTLVRECLTSETENGLFLMGYQGGYTTHPPNAETINIYVSDVAFWLKNGENMAQSNDRIQKELESYVNAAVPGCIIANNNQYQIEVQGVKSMATIFDENLLIDADVDILFRKGDLEKKTGEFSIINEMRLGLILNKARQVTEDLMDGYEVLDDSEFTVVSYKQERNRHVYAITDQDTIVNGNPYMFTFGIEMPDPQNMAPVIEKKGIIKIELGEPVYVDYNAADDYGQGQLTYSLVSQEIPSIDPVTGIIDFLPERIGTFYGIITVVDGFGEKDYDTLIVEVES